MRTKLVFLLTTIFISFSLQAKHVPQEDAMIFALNFAKSNEWDKNNGISGDLKIKSIITEKYNGSSVYHIINLSQGWLILSADDRLMPIIGYNPEGSISLKNQSPEWKLWMNSRAQEIEKAIVDEIGTIPEIEKAWEDLYFAGKSMKTNGTAGPLLLSNWDQGSKYNAACPEESFGPGGHVYAGCVATSMAQIMYYYKYPYQGEGSSGFYDFNYGYLSADYGNSYYDWDQMVNEIGINENPEIAELLYHCGVSVEMSYSASGSGAWPSDCINAYVNYFKYDNGATMDYKSSNTDTQWKTKIKASIDAGIPLLYFGWPNSGGSGHAFNLDGYQASDYFHFNWGWSGSYDGYYYLTSLNPGSYDFSSGQGALFNVKPNAANYPYNCQGTKTLSAIEGSVFDGSGPNNYNSNSDCRWLIEPSANVANIKITFDQLDLDTNDYLTIYDGNTLASSILASFTGTQVPSSITTTGGSMLLRFTSNGSNNLQGFHANYKAMMPVYCSGTKYLSDSSGVFTDGSMSNPYNNSTICRWSIDPPGNAPVVINFNYFNTEAGADFVKIYDPTQSPSLLLGSFSGSSIPPTVISQSGEAIVVFSTNSTNGDLGWEISYHTGNVSVEEESHEDFFRVFPIPAQSNIEIETVEDAYFKVISLTGQVMMKGDLHRGKNSIEINQLSNGVYTLQLAGSKIFATKLIQVQR